MQPLVSIAQIHTARMGLLCTHSAPTTPAKAASPSPTDKPTTAWLFKPPPLDAPPVAEGVNDVGRPVDETMDNTPVPNGTGLATDGAFVTGNVGTTPGATVVTSVMIER